MSQNESWRLKQKKARDLKSQGMGLVFDRVDLYILIEDDQEFIDDCDSRGIAPVEHLDSELMDTGFRYLSLKELVDYFPNKNEWEKRGTQSLMAEMMLAKEPKKNRHEPRTNWKLEYEKLLVRVQSLEEQNKLLRNMLKLPESELVTA